MAVGPLFAEEGRRGPPDDGIESGQAGQGGPDGGFGDMDGE